MSNKWVIGGAEVDEPVPVAAFPQQNRGGVERVGHHGGPSIGDEVGLLDDLHVPKLLEQRVAPYELHQIHALLTRGLQVEVHHVAVVGVVEGEEGALDGAAVAGGAGDEVGKARRRWEGGGGEGVELGFDEDRV